MKGAGAVEWFQRFLALKDNGASYALGAPLRMSDDAWVFQATSDGIPVVLKRFLTADPAHTVNRLRAELDHLGTAFQSKRFTANQCLRAWPEDGVVMLSHAAGARLDKTIWARAGEERAALFQASGAWLAEYCSGRKRSATFGPRFWLKKMQALPKDRLTHPDDLRRADALMQHLQRSVETVRGRPVTQAATHGDFVGMNIHHQNGALCGVDIQGESWLPLARDAARFLVWSQIHDPGIRTARQHGIAADDLAAFLASNLLDPEEAGSILPFFIGEQIYLRFLENAHRKSLQAPLRATLDAFVQTG